MAVGGIIYNFLKFFSLSLFYLKPVWIVPAFFIKRQLSLHSKA